MTPISLRQTGEYDLASEVTVSADGRYTAEHGGYVTAGVRSGQLSPRRQRELDELAAAVRPGDAAPAGAVVSVLTVGDVRVAWAGAPPTAEVAALVGALARL